MRKITTESVNALFSGGALHKAPKAIAKAKGEQQ